MSIDVLTFGCRLNTYESEVIRRHAVAAGLSDVVVVNTCAVTAEAERQARQAIRKAKRERPQARIIVTGCAAQTGPDRFAAMAEVDRVIGNDDKIAGEAWIAAREALARPPDFGIGGEQKIVVNDIMSVKQTAAHLIEAIIAISFLIPWESTHRHPVVDLHLFGRRNFRVGTCALGAAYFAFMGVNIIFPLWLQTTVGYTATWAGFAIAPVGLLSLIITPFVGRFIGRINLRLAVPTLIAPRPCVGA